MIWRRVVGLVQELAGEGIRGVGGRGGGELKGVVRLLGGDRIRGDE